MAVKIIKKGEKPFDKAPIDLKKLQAYKAAKAKIAAV